MLSRFQQFVLQVDKLKILLFYIIVKGKLLRENYNLIIRYISLFHCVDLKSIIESRKVVTTHLIWRVNNFKKNHI